MISPRSQLRQTGFIRNSKSFLNLHVQRQNKRQNKKQRQKIPNHYYNNDNNNNNNNHNNVLDPMIISTITKLSQHQLMYTEKLIYDQQQCKRNCVQNICCCNNQCCCQLNNNEFSSFNENLLFDDSQNQFSQFIYGYDDRLGKICLEKENVGILRNHKKIPQFMKTKIPSSFNSSYKKIGCLKKISSSSNKVTSPTTAGKQYQISASNRNDWNQTKVKSPTSKLKKPSVALLSNNQQVVKINMQVQESQISLEQPYLQQTPVIQYQQQQYMNVYQQKSEPFQQMEQLLKSTRHQQKPQRKYEQIQTRQSQHLKENTSSVLSSSSSSPSSSSSSSCLTQKQKLLNNQLSQPISSSPQSSEQLKVTVSNSDLHHCQQQHIQQQFYYKPQSSSSEESDPLKQQQYQLNVSSSTKIYPPSSLPSPCSPLQQELPLIKNDINANTPISTPIPNHTKQSFQCQPYSTTQLEGSLHTIGVKSVSVTKGGVCFQLNPKQFVYQDQLQSNPDKTGKAKAKTIKNTAKNPEPKKIMCKQELQRRRLLAKSYDRHARYQLFGI